MKGIVIGLVSLLLTGCLSTEATMGELHVKRTAILVNMGKVKATATTACAVPPCPTISVEEEQTDSTTALIQAVKAGSGAQ